MHLVFAWSCEEATAERRTEIRAAFEARLAQYTHVRIFDEVYAVQVMGNGIYELLQYQLGEIAKAQAETVKFVMSPMMETGVYHGRLGSEAVEGLKKIVQ